MKKLLTLFVAGLAINASVMAQNKAPQTKAPETKTQEAPAPILKFDATHHDFGKIKEDDGPVTYVFKFKNTGNAPLKLTNVQPACGCTASSWTKEDVAPGKEGEVKATYDVNHRPGPFNKSITVYSNSNPNITLLTFSGEVLPHVKTLTDSFPQVSGNLRFENNYLNYGYLTNNIKDTFQELYMINTGTAPVTIRDIRGDHPYISIKKMPFTVKPGQRVKLPVHYNASQNNDYGMIFDRIKLVTDDSKDSMKAVDVIADIHQFVPKLTDAEKEKAAKIVFVTNTHDFGTIKQGESVKTQFEFTNKGKQELVIYKVKTTCGCTASQPQKSKLKPGETSNILVSFDSAGKHGKEEKSITVYTNDPSNPEVTLKISANITTPENDKSGAK
ncbi:MAG: DUF1573 domain-containing protein [Sphingobacteriales bacterium]|nr:MAG: DUF1573 domain-containing protein [Sphingobacteriales bacterium]